MNPCVIPEPPEDVVGDGRWMSMVSGTIERIMLNGFDLLIELLNEKLNVFGSWICLE